MEANKASIAILGAGCRLPGGIDSPSGLWEVLKSGTNTWSHVPEHRFTETSFIHPDGNDPNGSHNHHGGHFLKQDIREFDNEFFNISAQEAAAMDPQQRLLLETVYEALEDAGQSQDKIHGSNTSVHVAMFTRDYDRNDFKDTLNIPRHHLVGSGEAILANRISFAFDLRGPSMTLDTGCSGGLVALHQACQALKLGECDMAIVGSVNLILSPDHQIGMSNLHMTNSEGRCYPFDSRGSGYGRGEGFTAVVLKRLDKAVAARDPIQAVILGSSVNQDGRTTGGITHPSATAQADLQRRLYRRLDLDPLSISYVEAHGTGTVAGDHEEVSALAETLCQGRTQPLYIGSLKSNIGHLESSSGLASLVKSLLMLKHRQLVPNADFRKEKEGLQLQKRKMIVPTNVIPFEDSQKVRIAVNSFGYGGTNAHIVLEESAQMPYLNSSLSNTTQVVPRLFVISAKSKASLAYMIQKYHKWAFSRATDIALSSLAYTLSQRRSQYRWRFSCVANGPQNLLEKLMQVNIVKDPTQSSKDASINFVFTGQGAQWPRMGYELLTSNAPSPFVKSIQRSRLMLLRLGATWDLMEELLRPDNESLIHIAEVAQPATTALQIALVDLLASMNIVPSTAIGHSSGEIAAAYTAGYLSHLDALSVSFHRGFASSMSRRKGFVNGAMLAVDMSESDISAHIDNLKTGKVTVACINSPRSLTISGDNDAINELQVLLSSKEIFNRKLRVDTAYHSHHMQAVAQEYKDLMGTIATQTPTKSVKFFSTVSGRQKSDNFGAEYWVSNLVSTVQFNDGLQRLYQTEPRIQQVFVEIGPHNALAGPCRQSLTALSEDVKYEYISPLKRGQNSIQSLLEAVGQLYESGQDIQFASLSSFDPESADAVVLQDLPSYSWDHSKKHWHESRLSRDYRLRKHPYHDLCGVRSIESTSIEPRWRHMIDKTSLPWLQDHVIDELAVFPGSGYICMAIEAISQFARESFPNTKFQTIVLRDIEFVKALLVPDSPERMEAQLSFAPLQLTGMKRDGLSFRFRVSAIANDGPWNEHCRGEIEILSPQAAIDDLQTNMSDELRTMSSNKNAITASEIYKQLRTSGNDYGPTFVGIDRMSLGKDKALATMAIPKVVDIMPAHFQQPHIIHPTTLDILMHSSLPLVSQRLGPGSIMPQFIKELTILTDMLKNPGDQIAIETKLHSCDPLNAEVSIEAFNPDGNTPCVSFSGLELRKLPKSSPMENSLHNADNSYWNLSWDLDADCLSSNAFKLPQTSNGNHTSRDDKIKALNDATDSYIRNCLHAVQRNNLAITENHQRLFDWMVRYGKENSLDDHCEDMSEHAHSRGILHGHDFVEMDLVKRTGSQLDSIVSGQADALGLVLEDDLLYRSYQDESSARCYDLLAQFAKLLCFKKSNLRVLEIGAGTGGTSLPFLEAMREAGHSPAVYDFTDISTGFFDRAATLLSNFPVTYRRLDIERDPVEQGFEAGSYDLILASNCLHATSDIRKTLKNVRRLLKANGQLALIEVVNVQPYQHITFGTLPGYWKGSVDGRVNGPFMTIQKWKEAMEKSSLDMLLNVNDDASSHLSSLMIARHHEDDQSSLETSVQIISVRENSAGLASTRQSLQRSQQVKANVDKFDTVCLDNSAIQIIIDDGEKPLLSNISEEQFERVRSLLTRQSRVLWISASENEEVSANPAKQLITGLARSAHSENDNLCFITVDVQQPIRSALPELVNFLNTCVSRLITGQGKNDEREYVYQDDAVLIPRLLPANKVNAWISKNKGSVLYEIQDRSDLPMFHSENIATKRNTLASDSDQVQRTTLLAGEIEIRPSIMKMLHSEYASSPTYICLGVVTRTGTQVTDLTRGNRVIAISTGPEAKRLQIPATDVQIIPEDTDLATTAALSLAMMSACYILFDLVGSISAQKIAIQGARSNVGLAILLLARHLGIQLVVLANEAADLVFLEGKIQVPPSRIIRSDLLDNAPEFQTIGKLSTIIDCNDNTISPHLTACLDPFGKVVIVRSGEENTVQTMRNDQLPTNATIHVCDIYGLIQSKPKRATELLKQAGSFISMIRIASHELFDKIPDIVKSNNAFEEVSSSTQYCTEAATELRKSSSNESLGSQISTRSVESGATFVIAGGLGELGRKLLLGLAKQGAGQLVLLSRNSPTEEKLRELNASVRVYNTNCTVRHVKCDIADEHEVKAVATALTSAELPPVKGIIQSAMQLQDRTLDSMTLSDFQIPLQAKVKGTLNLYHAFHSTPLCFFICLSSSANIIGTSGQGNYNAGNALQDALAHTTVAGGCQYMTLNIGMIEGTESVRDNETRVNALRRSGLYSTSQEDIEAFFEYVLSPAARGATHTQLVTGFNKDSLSHAASVNGNIRSPMFTHVLGNAVTQVHEVKQAAKKSFSDVVAAGSAEQVHEFITTALTQKLSSLLYIHAEDIDVHRPIYEFGFDSLVAIELRNWIKREFKSSLQSLQILNEKNIESLSKRIQFNVSVSTEA